ncbi:hypothetical protein SCLCIDRAFT_28844 [Scleroderma citrinum Foug A]|uniref:Uncharacterized protein n=1 Tax=Scleroderma citrinum Foug A TaxID=1036808 RepID=A0A0C2ZY29_9AGAM|nr:hypothetical protein SCLCIDRAFT_28844 [Scleroderma citrinum Foug A]
MEPTGKTSEEVEVPKLAKNGRNWKIYHTKIIEATATDITDPLGVLAGWQPDDGSYDWECLDAILKWTFYTSVPITILCPIRKLDTAHEIFNYLVKCFCDNNPIMDPRTKKSEPSANKVDGAGTATEDISTDLEKWKESPTSKSAAAETLVSANRDNNEDLSTKALTRGTEDVDGRNTGRMEDPHTSFEASAKGTSTKCAEMTPVILESALLHEMQTEPHNSLPLTPSRCKQEAADSVVMAGRTNGMVRMAEPTEIADVNLEKAAPDGELAERAHRIDEGDETDADIDRTALLGGEPAEMACRVDEGDGTEHGYQVWLQQTGFYCEESRQRSGNTTEDIPSAQKLLLEGEWSGYASGEASDPKVDGIESKGCKGGTDEPMELLMMSVKPDVEDGGDILRVNLGNRADRLRGQTDTLSVLNRAVTTGLSHSDGARTYLATGDVKRGIMETDGAGIHVDASSGRGDALSIETNTSTTANEMQSVSIPRKKAKPPDSPVDTTRTTPVEPNGFRDHTDGSDAWMDVQSVGYKRETAENETESVSTRQVDAQMRNSLHMTEVGMPEPTIQWRKVSGNNIDVYIPWNAPVEALGRTFAFGWLESTGEAIAPIIEGERAGNGGGDRNSDDESGDGDGMASSGNVDSMQVSGVQLAGEAGHPSDIQTAPTETSGVDVDVEESKSHLQRSAKHKKSKRPTSNACTSCSHAETTRNVPIESLDPAVDAIEPRPHPQRSAKHKTAKRLTWDMPTSRSHPGTLQSVDMESLDSSVDMAASRSNLQMSIERGTAETLT